MPIRQCDGYASRCGRELSRWASNEHAVVRSEFGGRRRGGVSRSARRQCGHPRQCVDQWRHDVARCRCGNGQWEPGASGTIRIFVAHTSLCGTCAIPDDGSSRRIYRQCPITLLQCVHRSRSSRQRRDGRGRVSHSRRCGGSGSGRKPRQTRCGLAKPEWYRVKRDDQCVPSAVGRWRRDVACTGRTNQFGGGRCGTTCRCNRWQWQRIYCLARFT